MEKQTIVSKLTGDSYFKIKHPSGLDILVCEMPGFSSTEALFGTKYGSVNTMFKTKADKDYTVVPEGIAHFLEHKLFENEDSDVFELYAKTGASANAFTSFDKTCYLFGCSQNWQESLRILLSFVQSPYFTKESVDKEQGIIGQEINMCNDDPSWRVLFNMLRSMYKNHPVRIDIAGTIESIAQIDADLLYKCYNTFYNLHNMVLVIAGNVNTDEVLKIADEELKPCENIELETVFPEEPYEVAVKEIRENRPVGVPMFNIGIKCKALDGYASVKAEMECDTVMNILCDTSSPLYKEMMDEGLINSTFGTEVFCGDGFFSLIFSGESNKPEEVMHRIFKEIEKAKADGLDKEHFEVIKKSNYGKAIKRWNGPNYVANALINSYFSGVSGFDSFEILSEMKYEDVQRCLCEMFDTENYVLSIIESGENG